MQYILNKDNLIVAIHTDDQNVIGSYPADHKPYFSKENLELLTVAEIPADYRSGFESACAQFRTVCNSIGTLIYSPGFAGGFDEMAQAQSAGLLNSPEGMGLALAWMAANELCIYEGKKIGYNQPGWWYECWGLKR